MNQIQNYIGLLFQKEHLARKVLKRVSKRRFKNELDTYRYVHQEAVRYFKYGKKHPISPLDFIYYSIFLLKDYLLLSDDEISFITDIPKEELGEYQKKARIVANHERIDLSNMLVFDLNKTEQSKKTTYFKRIPLYILLVVSIPIVYYFYDQTIESNKTTDAIAPNNIEEEKPAGKPEINEELIFYQKVQDVEKQLRNIEVYSQYWSPDSQYVVYVEHKDESSSVLKLWDIDDPAPIILKENDTFFPAITWAPNGKFIVIGEPTDEGKVNEIYSIEDLSIYQTFHGDTNEILWSPNSSYIIFSRYNKDIEIVIETDYYYGTLWTTDLVLFDLETGGFKTLLQGDQHQYYYVQIYSPWIKLEEIDYNVSTVEMSYEYQTLNLLEVAPEISQDHVYNRLNKLPDEIEISEDLPSIERLGLKDAAKGLSDYLKAQYFGNLFMLEENYFISKLSSASHFRKLMDKYREYVDFESIEIQEFSHKDYSVEYILSYKNKKTGEIDTLRLIFKYTQGSMEDLSEFE